MISLNILLLTANVYSFKLKGGQFTIISSTPKSPFPFENRINPWRGLMGENAVVS